MVPSFRYLLGISLGTTALTLGIQGLGLLQLLEWTVLDQWVRSRPAEQWTSPVVIVAIDEADVASNGNWPLTDQQLARLLMKIKQYRPAAIGLDLYRDLPIAPGQDELTQVLQTTPNLVVVEKIIRDRGAPPLRRSQITGAPQPVAIAPPAALQGSDQVAFNDLVLDQDGHIRRYILSMRHHTQTKHALGTKLALLYLQHIAQIEPQALANHQIRLGQTTLRPLERHVGAYVDVDAGGYQILANPMRLTQGIPMISMQDLLANRLPPGNLQQKVVLVGLKTDTTWGDRFYTAYSQDGTDSWAGVEIHANLTAQLIASALEGRSQLHTLPEPLEWAWIFIWAMAGVAANRILVVDARLLRLPLLIGSLVLLSFGLFVLAWWVPLIAPVVALSSAWLVTQGYLVWTQLQHENQRLETIVTTRTQELQLKNQELEQARIEADRANQAKSTFLAHISHELRTPLTAILGFGDLLEHAPHLPATEREYAETINRSGEHLLALINNVLELSKIETGSMTLKPETIHLPTLLHEIETLFQAQAMAKQLDFQLDCTPIQPDWIDVDGAKLRQILINLVGNAVKFTTAGHVLLRTRLRCRCQGQVLDDELGTLALTNPALFPGIAYHLECAVDDTGPGLKDIEIEQLFQPFVQTTAGTNLRKGTGLGLALVQQWVELMKGTIEVHSTYGQGSCFIVQIPIKVPLVPWLTRQSPPVSTPAPTPDAQQTYRVLIVEDELECQHLLTQWFADAPYEIETTELGTRAVQIAEHWHPHVILLDIHLPDIDGYEVARRIREQWHISLELNNSSTLMEEEPVILAITAGVLQDKYADLLAVGCDDVLWKPLKSETLFAKIAEHL